jgi:hypothetical protein
MNDGGCECGERGKVVIQECSTLSQNGILMMLMEQSRFVYGHHSRHAVALSILDACQDKTT